jgi:hypothetical protein
MEYWPYGIDRLGVAIGDYLRAIESTFRYGTLLRKEQYREYAETGSLRLEPIGNVLKPLEEMGTRDTYYDVLLAHTERI